MKGGTVEEINLFGETEFNGVPTDSIQTLFDFWKETFHKRSTTVLDDARRKKIATAIKAYGEETCRQAIIGCSLSDWPNGRNPGNKKYHDLTLIFRNADKVEMFVDIYEQEHQGQKEMDEWLNT
jgi:hypothetical protein